MGHPREFSYRAARKVVFIGPFSKSLSIFPLLVEKFGLFRPQNIDTMAILCYIQSAFFGFNMCVFNLTLFAVEGESVPSTVFFVHASVHT